MRCGLLQAEPVIVAPGYLVALYLVAPAFYLFFRGALQPRSEAWAGALLLYGPALLGWWIPPAIGLPLAFVFGTLYALLLTRLALRLRGQRKRFRLEAIAFAAHGLVAILILILGLGVPWLGIEIYVLGYSILIGLGLLAALYTLLRIPDLIDEPHASVLSVGLAVGFTSQSNFYTAFREITGDVPGGFRRRKADSGR